MSKLRHNKNVSRRLRLTLTKHDRNKDKTSSADTGTDPPSTEFRTVYVINVIPGDENPVNTVLSLDHLVERFSDGIVVYDYGKITVYLKPSVDFLAEIENTTFSEQSDFSNLHDVYAVFKTFLIYRSRYGKTMLLPKNQHFYTIFGRLKDGVFDKGLLISRLAVLLRDIYRQEQQNEPRNDCQECCTENISGPMLGKSRCTHGKCHVTKTKEMEATFQENISLQVSKKRIFFGIKRVPVPLLQKHPLLPRLQPSTSLDTRIYQYPLDEGQFHLPVQVSGEHRGEEAPSEQVISFHSTVYRDDIGLDQQSGFSNGLSTHVSHESQHNVIVREPTEQRPRVQPRHPDYSQYGDRLISYASWLHRRPDPASLSQAGFFFTNQGDLVRCFQCGIGLKDFSEDDDPLLEHVRHSGKCLFLTEFLGAETLAIYQNRLQSVDPEYNRHQQWTARQNGSAPRLRYRHPEYQTVEARISSFTNWPAHMSQTPQQLADAGLYYTGFEDQVRCFACDGGLRRWDPADDPWTEHCRWFPACPFALEQKGEQFIALIQASVENERYGASGGDEQNLAIVMEQLKLRESVTESLMTQYKATLTDMGYKVVEVKDAVQELLDRGIEKPSLEDIIILIDVIRERKLADRYSSADESPYEENKRLKRIVYCMSCRKNTVNALFLPCTHHELCMECAGLIDNCPVCNRGIQEKIRTYMA